jgi:hypothetical protein
MALFAVAPAHAAFGTATVRPLTQQFRELQWAGDLIAVYWSMGQKGTTQAIEGVAPGRPVRKLLVYHRKPHTHYTYYEFGSSGAALAIRKGQAYLGSELPTQFLAGPLGGPYVGVGRCPGYPLSDVPPVASGTLTAFAGGDCSPSHVLLHDTAAAAGPDVTIDAAGPVVRVAMAGRYLAMTVGLDPATYQVDLYDLQAHAFAATIPTSFRPGAVSVQSDGTAVVSNPDGAAAGPCYWWFSAAAPALHAIPLGACITPAPVKIAGGRLAFLSWSGSGINEYATLATANLDGTDVIPVAEFLPTTSEFSFDFDGTTLAWQEMGCTNWHVRTRVASETAPPVPPQACPVRVGRPVVRADGIHVGIRCPNGCDSDDAGLAIIEPGWLRTKIASEGLTRYYAGFHVKAGKRTTLVLPLDRSARAKLAQARSVRVRIKVVGLNIYEPSIFRTLRAP